MKAEDEQDHLAKCKSDDHSSNIQKIEILLPREVWTGSQRTVAGSVVDD